MPELFRIRWKQNVFTEIRKSEPVNRLVFQYAKKGANAAGDGFIARVTTRPGRARAAVIAATIRARRKDARDHILVGPVIEAMKN